MSVAILGIGIVSASGSGVDAFRRGLQCKEKPLILRQTVRLQGGDTVEMPYYEAVIAGLEEFVPPQALRRLPRFSRMALLAANLAVKDSGVKIEESDRTGIIIGSGYGPLQASFSFLDSIIDGSDACPSPTTFANSVHNSLASIISILMKIHGPSLTLNSFDATPSVLFHSADLWLQKNDLDYVLLGAGEECCPVRTYSTARLSGTEGSIQPFRLNVCTYVPGDGFVFYLIGRAERADKIHLTFRSGKGESRDASDSQILFLAANGDRNVGKNYEYLLSDSKQLRSFSPLYGSMVTGVHFELAAAAICLRDSKLYPNPVSSGDAAGDIIPIACEEISCIQYDEAGSFLSITARRPG
jgi:3-oxoacyl-[acyl-carrier-protein] synthase II